MSCGTDWLINFMILEDLPQRCYLFFYLAETAEHQFASTLLQLPSSCEYGLPCPTESKCRGQET